jgi:hypothetical protein
MTRSLAIICAGTRLFVQGRGSCAKPRTFRCVGAFAALNLTINDSTLLYSLLSERPKGSKLLKTKESLEAPHAKGGRNRPRDDELCRQRS